MTIFAKNDRVFIFTVISEEYARLGLVWGRQVQRLTGISPHFICSDTESLKIFSSEGFPCSAYLYEKIDESSSHDGYGEIHFPNEKAVFTISLKFAVASEYLKAGYSVLFSDVDAIWMKDPLPEFDGIDTDFMFQPGSFPEAVKERWGFSVCTGFFFIRSNARTITFSNTVHECFDGDDQRTLNNVLTEHYDIFWSTRPENWEHCALHGGWTEPVLGVCHRTSFSATALAHSFYQRHGTRKDTCGHAIICHPNSPKDQEGKFETLEGLGIDLQALPRLPGTNAATSKPRKFVDWAKRLWSSHRS